MSFFQPFAPDFWESASEPKPSIPPAVDIDNRPKLVVVAGAHSRPISATSQEVIEPEAPNVLPNLPKLGQGGLLYVPAALLFYSTIDA
jgi:hypothetical protein